MKSFLRAAKDALRYWPLLVVSFLCSAGVASMWGANIAALSPLIDVTIHGTSFPKWNLIEHDRMLVELANHEKGLEQIDAKLTEPGANVDELTKEANKLRGQIGFVKKAIESNEWMQPLLDRYAPSTPFSTVIWIVVMLLVSNLLKQVLLMANTSVIGYVSTSIARDLRTRLFDKALRFDRVCFSGVGTGGFAATITNTAEMLGQGILNFYGGAITEPLKIGVCLCGALFISWRLTLASFLVAPLVMVLVVRLNKLIKETARVTLDRSMGFQHIILESLGNLMTIQANTMEDYESSRFREATRQLRRNSIKAVILHALTGPVTELLGIGMICVGILVGSYLVLEQRTDLFGIRMTGRPMDASELMLFFAALVSMNDPIRKLSTVITAINTGSVAAKALFDMIDLPPRIADPAKPRSPVRSFKEISFDNVTFWYHQGEPILQNIHLKIPAGRRVAIVGPNGGGKSTLINLLCRFYDPVQGRVKIDDVPIREMTLKDLRSRIALVTQHTELFNESVMYNIRYGCWDATDEEVIEAAKKAYAHEFISGFTNGYKTLVGANGQRLSGGQRQRIALARALLRKAEILILDEATSQIDMASEKLIHDSLHELGRERTLLMVTHRPSTLALADDIIEVERGKITMRPKLESHVAA
jgi:subfamily B ATP-binding cassette protein MsbA